MRFYSASLSILLVKLFRCACLVQQQEDHRMVIGIPAPLGAPPQFDHRTALGLGTPPSFPQLDEISGPFEIKVVARIDSTNLNWPRLFDFGTGLNTGSGGNAVSFAVHQGGNSVRLRIHGSNQYSTGAVREVSAHGEVDIGEVITWTVGVDENYVMYIKKNGVQVNQNTAGVWPDAVQRQYKYIGKSLNDNEADLSGAVLGLQFVKGNTSNTALPLPWMNFPGQLNGGGFVVSGYAQFHSTTSGSWQRVFDFSDDAGSTVNLGQRDSSNDMRLEVVNPSTGESCVVDASNEITEMELAFWEAGVSVTGVAWIRKNGVELVTSAECPVPTDVFRSKNKFGSSNNPLHSPLNGDVLGMRLDRENDLSRR